MQANINLINSLKNYGLNPDEWIIVSINWATTVVTFQKWEDSEIELQANLVQKNDSFIVQNPIWII